LKIKLKLKEQHFKSIEEIQAELQDMMEMLSQNYFHHGNPIGITVLMQKGTTSKEMEESKNVDNWLSLVG
jgi:hypothetical protein